KNRLNRQCLIRHLISLPKPSVTLATQRVAPKMPWLMETGKRTARHRLLCRQHLSVRLSLMKTARSRKGMVTLMIVTPKVALTRGDVLAREFAFYFRGVYSGSTRRGVEQFGSSSGS